MTLVNKGIRAIEMAKKMLNSENKKRNVSLAVNK
jgi:hypothetical protein